MRLLLHVLLSVLLCGLAIAAEPASPSAPSSQPDVVIEKVDTSYRCDGDGTVVVHQSVRARAVTAAGRQALGQATLFVVAPIEEAHFDHVHTIKPDGRVITADPSVEVKLEQSRSDELAKLGLVKAVSVAPLEFEPGDTIDYAYTKTSRPVQPGEFWLTHELAGNVPVESEVVTLDVPASRRLAIHLGSDPQPGLETSKDRTVYRWSVAARNGKSEPLFAVSTVTTWEALGRSFARMQPDPASTAVTAKAKALTAGIETTWDRTRALYAWVSRSVRSIGAPFAVHGYRSRPPDEVVRTGWGDCKDKHVLLAALLAACGIQARPALVSTSGKVPFLDVPALSQFDHVVTVVRVDGQDHWLDTTLEVARPDTLLPAIRGSRALLVEPGVQDLTTVPKGSSDTTWRVREVGSLEPSGRLTVNTTIEVEGDYELFLRILVHNLGAEMRAQWARSVGERQVAGGTVAEVQGTDALDSDSPFTISYRITHPSFASGPRPMMTVPSLIPALLADRASGSGTSGSVDDTTQPRPAGRVIESVELTLPTGAATEVPFPMKLDTADGGYQSSYERTATGIKANRSLILTEVPNQGEGAARQATLLDLTLRDASQTVLLAPAVFASTTPESSAASSEELLTAAQSLLDAGKPAEAVTMLELVCNKEPGRVDALLRLASAYRAIKRWPQAEATLRRALTANPLHPEASAMLVNLLIERQRYDEAVVALDAASGANPLDLGNWLTLATLHHDLGELPKALVALEGASRAERQNPLPRILRALLLQELGRTDEATTELAEAKRLADALGYREAMPDLDMPFSRLTPPWMRPSTGLAIQLPADAADPDAMSRADAAISKLAALQGTDPGLGGISESLELAEALSLAARADRNAGQLERARGRLRAALDLSLDAAIAADLADVCARLGRFDEAVRAWALANRDQGAAPPAALAAHFTKIGLKGEALGKRLKDSGYDVVTAHSIPWSTLQGSKGCPPDGRLREARVRVLVDSAGSVTGARAFSGFEGCQKTAVAAAKRLKLPRLLVDGQPVATVRTVLFAFHPGGDVEAQWGYGLDPQTDLVSFAGRIAVGKP